MIRAETHPVHHERRWHRTRRPCSRPGRRRASQHGCGSPLVAGRPQIVVQSRRRRTNATSSRHVRHERRRHRTPAARPTSRAPGSRTTSPGRRTARGSPSTGGSRIDDRRLGRPADRRSYRVDGRCRSSRSGRRRSPTAPLIRAGRPTGRRSCCRLPGDRSLHASRSSGTSARPIAIDVGDRARRASSTGASARRRSWQRARALSGVPRRPTAPLAGQGRTPGGRARGSRCRRLGCGERIRTSDLRVMSPTSCRCSTPRPVTLGPEADSVKRLTGAPIDGGRRSVRARPFRRRPPMSSPSTRRDRQDRGEDVHRIDDVRLGEDAGDAATRR